MTMKKISISLVILFLAALSVAWTGEPLTGKAARITDGDTFVLRTKGQGDVKVQLYGIDAPERDASYGSQAAEALSAMLKGKKIRVEEDYTDRLGRTVGHVYVGKKDVGLELVRQGFARYVERYAPGDAGLPAAEAEARRHRRGMWAAKSAEAPVAGSPEPAAPHAAPSSPAAKSARVERVQDGDSCILSIPGGGLVRIRLYGIDAPELSQEYGEQAKAALASLVEGKAVRYVQKDIDPYGRIVALLYVDGAEANLEMIRKGAAWHNDKFAPHDTYLKKAEQSARSARRGLWAAPHPLSPWKYKRLNPRN